MPTKKIETPEVIKIVDVPMGIDMSEKTEKEKLLDLYQEMKDRGIRSISDIENMIAKAE
mgnify:CR=1 FL=1